MASGSVLVIGDSISLGWMPHAQELLPEVDFVHARNGMFSNNIGTKHVLALAIGVPARRIDVYVDPTQYEQVDGPWDMIIYNSGVHDMRSGSWHGTTPEEYSQNLNEIYDVIETQDAPILWLTTTPIPVDSTSSDHTLQASHRAASIEIANERADGVLDLFAAVYDDFPSLQVAPDNLHFSDSGSAFLASLIVDAVAEPDVASEFYYVDGDAPLWPPEIFNPYAEPEPPPPPPLFNGVDFLRWQQYFEGPATLASEVMGGENFLSWQRFQGSRPLYQRTPIRGEDFLSWQLHESSLQGDAADFGTSTYLGWQRIESRDVSGLTRLTASSGVDGIVTVPEPASTALVGLMAYLLTLRAVER